MSPAIVNPRSGLLVWACPDKEPHISHGWDSPGDSHGRVKGPVHCPGVLSEPVAYIRSSDFYWLPERLL